MTGAFGGSGFAGFFGVSDFKGGPGRTHCIIPPCRLGGVVYPKEI